MHARQLVCKDPTSINFSLCFAYLMSTRELGAYCPQYVLTIFYVCRIQIRQVSVIRLCGSMSQICITAFSLQFMFITFCECKQIMVILNTSSVSILSVSIFFDSTSVILSSLLLNKLCSSPYTINYSRS